MRASAILKDLGHRPWPLPQRSWTFHQHWKDIVFCHWSVDAEVLRSYVPDNLDLDLHNGKAWLTIICFSMNGLRPRFLPSVPAVSDFHQLNIRTYVKYKGKPGVYLLHVDVEKFLPSVLGTLFSGVTFNKADITRKKNKYSSRVKDKGTNLLLEYDTESGQTSNDQMNEWMFERYAFFQIEEGEVFSFDLHHEKWSLQDVRIENFTVDNPDFNPLLVGKPQLAHYCPGISVLLWSKKRER